jgi:polo-like kinase 1
MQIKVGDFGLATQLTYDGERKKTICGTPNYIAPEILDTKMLYGLSGHSYEVDYWSIGVIVYTLLFGRPPFESAEVKNTYKKIKACNYTFPDNVKVSEQAKQFISAVLVLDPKQRLNLKKMTEHEFLTGTPIPDLLPVSSLVCPPTQVQYQRLISTPVL